MEAQEILKKKIGTKEMQRKSLEPKKVKIANINVEHVEKAKSDKIVFECSHPDSDKPINLSSVSYIDDREIVTYGTWVNLDDEGNLQKGSAVSKLMHFLKVDTLEECKDKEIDTELSGKYLVLKAY